MQINSTINVQQQYFNALENKHKENDSQTFKKELSQQNSYEKVQEFSQTTKVEEAIERFHEVLTYENTKGMTNEEVDKYFSERSEEERSHIKFMIGVSNNFSEDDIANEAIFIEAKSKVSLKSRQEFSIQMAKETMDYSLGTPNLSDVLRVSSEYVQAKRAGIENPEKQGIFMNAADKALYESGLNGKVGYNDTLLTSQEASDFLSKMLNLAQQRMDEARGTALFNDYKEAFERYQRMNDNYNSLLAGKEESTKVDINV